MSRGTRVVLIVAAVALSASFLMAAAAGVYVYRDGMIDVNVQEKRSGGTYVHVMVPTTLVRAVLLFVPLEDEMRADESCPYWPVVEAVCTGIARSPDGVLVQVDGPGEHVTIAKRGGSLVIDVDDADAKVRVSIPVRAVEFVVRRMRRASPGWGVHATFSLSEGAPVPASPATTSPPPTTTRMPAPASPRA